MMSKLNWGRLVIQGRAKAHGVSWSNKEGLAIVDICKELKMKRDQVAPYVRKGILTAKALIKAREKEGFINPYLKFSLERLVKKAKELGLNATPDTTVDLLAEIVLKEEERQKAEKEEEKEEAKAKKEAEAQEKEEKKLAEEKEKEDKKEKDKKEKEDAKNKEKDKDKELAKEETEKKEGEDDKEEKESSTSGAEEANSK